MRNAGIESKANHATTISRSIFGGVLHADSYGFYTGLEFFSILAGCTRANQGALPNLEDYPEVSPLHISHDFARRIAWPPAVHKVDENLCFSETIKEEKKKAFAGLIQSIAVPVPARRKESTWHNSHFFPYGLDLAHFDARIKGSKGNVSVEPIYYRGAGSLAFKILRSDPNVERRTAVAIGLSALFENLEDTLNKLLGALHQHDDFKNNNPSSSRQESEIQIRNDIFEENLRDGVQRILKYENITPAVRVDALLYFLPFALLRLQHGRARKILGLSDECFVSGVVDFGYDSSRLRRESKKSFDETLRDIMKGLNDHAKIKFADRDFGKKNLDQFKSFYSRTAGAIGLLNSSTGSRFYKLKEGLTEAVILAEVDAHREIPFSELCDRLYSRWGLVISRETAEKGGLLRTIDSGIFEKNSEHFADYLRDLGFLHDYNDMTRMVRYGH